MLPDKLYFDVICPWNPAFCRTKLYLMSLVRGNPPSAGQISVDTPAYLRRLPTAGNSEKLIDRVNGSATRLPRQCDLSVESRLLPDKLYFDVTCPWNPTFCRTKCSCSVYRYGWQKRYGLQQGCPREDLLISIPLTPFSRGHIRACGLSIATVPALPANSGPASDDALFGTRGRRLRSRRAWSSRRLLVASHNCFCESLLERKTEQPVLGLTVESIDS